MRVLLLCLPALLMGQTPAPKAAAPKAAAAPRTATPAKAAPKPATAAAKPAAGAPKAAAAKPATRPKPVAKPAALVPTTDDEKTIYALGLSIHRSLAAFSLSPAEMEMVKQALSDAASGKHAIELSEWGPKIEGLARARAALVTEKEKALSREYLTKAAAEPGAIKTESGIIFKELQAGTGEFPKSSDTVKVHYRGTLVNGTEFDSSYKRNEPAQFALTGVIKCWTEGVQKIKVGGKAKLVCPSDLAYGDQGRPSIPGGATLIFEVELLEISK